MFLRPSVSDLAGGAGREQTLRVCAPWEHGAAHRNANWEEKGERRTCRLPDVCVKKALAWRRSTEMAAAGHPDSCPGVPVPAASYAERQPLALQASRLWVYNPTWLDGSCGSVKHKTDTNQQQFCYITALTQGFNCLLALGAVSSFVFDK